MFFANKEYFLLFLLLIPYIWYLYRSSKKSATMLVADTSGYAKMPKSLRQRMMWMPNALRVAMISMLIIMLARPQTSSSWGSRTTEGIDIMLAMDVSTSMKLSDLTPSRISAAKSVAAEFINNRPDDNIGLTVFSAEAFTQCPMTTDHASLLNMLHSVGTDMAENGILEDGTAIGMGLANSLSRLKDSKAKSKVVILLTDGSNNCGEISPLQAAKIAKTYGIRVYTIAAYSGEVVTVPVQVGGTIQYVHTKDQVDEKSLAEIAQMTDGKFYRATNSDQLFSIYKEIDSLEKSKVDIKKFSRKNEAFQIFALLAVLLLMLEIILRQTWLRKLP
ncbi:MAG: VWA domain-containing protein [Bacteroidaceae bacterium]|nr:VWA domain-containing protein [Bacteroidaceae bacterium]